MSNNYMDRGEVKQCFSPQPSMRMSIQIGPKVDKESEVASTVVKKRKKKKKTVSTVSFEKTLTDINDSFLKEIEFTRD